MGSDDLQDRLDEALAECARLQKENRRLKSLLALSKEEGILPAESLIPNHENLDTVTSRSSTKAKVTLFRSLFQARDDIFAVRWESKNGRSGYSPACRNEWDKAFCRKPAVKCFQCEHRELLPLTDQVINDHLTGKITVGIYPLFQDETCRILAVDFDKASWQEDAAAFLRSCKEMGIPAALERSRSGSGGHVWIFFDHPVRASQARKLGCAVLTRTMERYRHIGLDSYDRFFPNQNTMPKGGFGNLIALPLQAGPRDKGNSLFLDPNFQPYPDQWAFLSSLRKMSAEEAEALVQEASRTGGIIGVRMSLTDGDSDEDPWALPPSKRRLEEPIIGWLPEKIRIVSGNLLYVEKEGLPPTLLNRLIRLAAFQNPEFYRAQAMRLPTFDKPRVIGCAEDFPKHIGLPRGCLDDVKALLKTHKVKIEFLDERLSGVPIQVAFKGTLNPLQQKAAEALLLHDIGTFSASTGFGKTIVGAWLIAARKVNTLILVHRRQLLDQWRQRLATFLDLSSKSIGQIGGGKSEPTGTVDVGLIQSLYRKGEVKDIVAEYGQIVVDECHHLPAFSFEKVLKQVKAKYVVGLTATPIRKDGHHPIIMMQCGPIRFRINAREQAKSRPFDHVVIPRNTQFRIPVEAEDLGIQDIYALLAADNDRNSLILEDLLKAVRARRSPLLLTERTEHLEYFAEKLEGLIQNVVVLHGGVGAKQRRIIAEQIATIPDGEERVLIATGRYIGEGFDDARLDTLFLTMPISWRGTLQQYAGRLHRLHNSKQVVQIYDYVDIGVPVLMRMYKKRLKGYQAIGYAIKPASGNLEQDEPGG